MIATSQQAASHTLKSMYSRGSNRVNVEPPSKVLFHKSLHSSASSTEASIAKSNENSISGIQISILNIHDDGFLKRSFVTLLVESNAQ